MPTKPSSTPKPAAKPAAKPDPKAKASDPKAEVTKALTEAMAPKSASTKASGVGVSASSKGGDVEVKASKEGSSPNKYQSGREDPYSGDTYTETRSVKAGKGGVSEGYEKDYTGTYGTYQGQDPRGGGPGPYHGDRTYQEGSDKPTESSGQQLAPSPTSPTAPPAGGTPPSMKEGGYVPRTGLIRAHEGEHVLSAQDLAELSPETRAEVLAKVGPNRTTRQMGKVIEGMVGSQAALYDLYRQMAGNG